MQKNTILRIVNCTTIEWRSWNESIQGAGIVQAFQQEEKIVAEYEATATSWVEIGRKELILESYFMESSWFTSKSFTLFGIVLLNAIIGGTLGISAGLLYAAYWLCQSYLWANSNPPYECRVRLPTINGCRYDRVFELMDTQARSQEKSCSLSMKEGLNLKRSFEYTPGVPVLKTWISR